MSEEKKNSGRIRTLPWVPESFHAPFSGCDPVFIVTRAASGFGLSPRSVGLFGRLQSIPPLARKNLWYSGYTHFGLDHYCYNIACEDKSAWNVNWTSDKQTQLLPCRLEIIKWGAPSYHFMKKQGSAQSISSKPSLFRLLSFPCSFK